MKKAMAARENIAKVQQKEVEEEEHAKEEERIRLQAKATRANP